MFLELFTSTPKRVSFEDVQKALKTNSYLLLNTLTENEQHCLIKNTISYTMEEKIINELLNQYQMKENVIIIYGKNTNDLSVEKKYKQLQVLGFIEIYIYWGGMFEWLLLQDIYGTDEFPTTSKVIDILNYKGKKTLV